MCALLGLTDGIKQLCSQMGQSDQLSQLPGPLLKVFHLRKPLSSGKTETVVPSTGVSDNDPGQDA